jgi:hypothetical protein
MPGKSNVGGFDIAGLVYLLSVLAVAFLPLLLGRRGSPPEQSDTDPGDGWGRGGSRKPPTPPSRPSGGIPLDHSEPARTRLRDHSRLADRLAPRERRRAREPDRRPVRTRGA